MLPERRVTGPPVTPIRHTGPTEYLPRRRRITINPAEGKPGSERELR